MGDLIINCSFFSHRGSDLLVQTTHLFICSFFRSFVPLFICLFAFYLLVCLFVYWLVGLKFQTGIIVKHQLILPVYCILCLFILAPFNAA